MKKIIQFLRNNSRIKLTEISQKTGMPLTTVHDAVEKIKKNGPINKFVSLIDFKKLGYGIRVSLVVKANRHGDLLDFLSGSPHVNNCYKISSGYIIESLFSDFAEYEDFKNILQSQGGTFDEHFILDEIKKEEFVVN